MSSIGDTHHHPMPRRNISCSANFLSAVCLSPFDREIRFANEAARCSAIAQLVEQATVNRPFVGSSPTRGASFLDIKTTKPLNSLSFSHGTSPCITIFLKIGLQNGPQNGLQINFRNQ